jgi:uncharacterized membrane protein YgcG
MKRFLVLSAVLAAFLPFAVHAETIHTFDVQAKLDANRNLTVTETIVYDFESLSRHGIYRDIPVVYSRNGASYRLRLSVGSVTMDGQSVPESVSSNGDNLRIKIGDPDRTITGRHTYVITYSTNRAINDFPSDNERELYWNVTGDAWPVDIEESSFTLDGPGDATKTICFTGAYGSTEQACAISASGNRVTASASRPLSSEEGWTVAIRFPASSMRDVSLFETLWNMLVDNWWLGLPVLVFFIMFGIWWKYGKDPAGRGTVVAQYEEPRKLPPGLLAALIEQSFSQRSVTATILDLGRRGYLKVKFTGESAGGWFSKSPKFTLVKLKDADGGMLPFEQTLFDGLFDDGDEISLESKKDGSFWKSIQKANEQAFGELRDRKLFNKSPGVVRGIWIAVAIGVGFLGFTFGEGLGVLSGILCGLIVLGFGWQMPSKTKEGAIVMEEAEGFKLFLSVTEKDRLDFTDAPERTPENFARFLPAAVAFGVEEKWAKQFAGIDMRPPSYYDGHMNGWSAVQFAQLSHSLHDSSVSGMYRAPSSGGSGGSGFSGGGSGGGFGGGGGGSW